MLYTHAFCFVIRHCFLRDRPKFFLKFLRYKPVTCSNSIMLAVVYLHDTSVTISLVLFGWLQRCAFTSVSRVILDCWRSADTRWRCVEKWTLRY